MSLTPGTRLGSYEILSPLGAGGMGEVYRARDTRLGRDVAIKTLPEEFAGDAERLSRFEREARVLASLTHSNIAAIHGVEEVEKHRYLVLEFVDGETLADRLARGALPVDEAIDVCRDIAAGLEAAHESGIVHRDLKPGNVVLTPSGQVKVLDFGLATASGATAKGSDPNLSHSPTLTHQATRAGVILGTAAYMSPEQARGRVVDRRTDIWSFGCVLYECLTGRPLFQGETVSDLIARILEREPDWSALPDNTPPRVRELLKRCLRKDPKERLRDIGDARLELSEAHATIDGATAPAATLVATKARRAWIPWAVACAAVLAAATAWLVRPVPPPAHTGSSPVLRLSIPLPHGLEVSNETPDAVLSPDGRTVAFVATDSSGTQRVYVRALKSASVRVLAGTEGAAIPFWSPDNRNLAFFADGNLLRLPIDGSSRPQVLGAAPSSRGGAWSKYDVIVFAPSSSGRLMQIPASGGAVTPATTLDTSRGETAHRFPQFLPDGEHFLYVALPGKDNRVDTRVGTLDAKPGPVVVNALSMATFASPGFLVFNQNESVVAQAFDPSTLKTSGAPRLVADLYNVVANYSGSPVVTTSGDGALIQHEFRTSGTHLVLMDRKGAVVRTLRLPEGIYATPRFSPDDRKIAAPYGRVDDSYPKIWMIDLARNVSTRFAFERYFDTSPVWTRDGRTLIWGSDSDEGRAIMWKPVDGSGKEEVLARTTNLFNDPNSVTHDALVFRSLSGQTNEDIWMCPLTGDHKPRPLIQTQFNELDAAVSPDERWMAYRSDESGKFELYVVAFPSMGGKVRVSIDGAAPNTFTALTVVRWRGDGRELYYVGGDGRTLMAAPVETGAEFRAGTPKPLFRFARETLSADVTHDGQQFVAVVPANEESRSILNLVINWQQELTTSP